MKFGFSYVGFVYIIMLIIPNLIWTKNQPKDYEKYAMNENKILAYSIIATSDIMLITAAVCLFLRQSTAKSVSAGLICLLSAALITMIISLHTSMRKTLYSYKNIGLIGGTLFAGALMAVLVWCFAASVRGTMSTASQIRSLLMAFPRQFSYYAIFPLTVVSIMLAVSNIALIRREGFCGVSIVVG